MMKRYNTPKAEIVLFDAVEDVLLSPGDNFISFGEDDNFAPYN